MQKQKLITVIDCPGTRCAATTHPVWRSELKYSTVYPIRGLEPALSWLLPQTSVTALSVIFVVFGTPGGDGNVLGSGVLCNVVGEVLFSTCNNTQK